MITLKNQIKEVKNTFETRVLSGSSTSPQINRDTIFNIRLFAIIEKSNILIEKADSIEIFFQTSDIDNSVENIAFSNMFPNLYANQTSDSKKYSNSVSGLPESYKNDIRSNLIVDYHNNSSLPISLSSPDFNSLFSTTVTFDKANFIENTDQYAIDLSQDVSRRIFDKALETGVESQFSYLLFFNKVRIAILDDKKNILDITNFFGIDLSPSSINESFSLVSFADFYGRTIEDFVDNFELEFLYNIVRNFHFLKLFGDNYIYLQDGLIEINVNYTSNNITQEIKAEKNFRNFISESKVNIYSTSVTSGNIVDFIKEIVKDYLCGVESFIVDVEINFKKINNNGGSENYSSIRSFSKTTTFNRQSTFVENALAYCDETDETGAIIDGMLNNINVDVLSTETIGTKVGIDFDLFLGCPETYDDRILDSILVEEIKIDIGRNKGRLDFYYNQPDFDLSNKIDYRNKSIRFFNNNSKIWSIVYLASIFRNIFEFSFTIKHIDKGTPKTITKNVHNFESVNQISAFVENTQNLTNRIFNENMFCGDIDFNLFLNESTGNIFNYEIFILKNSNLFRNVALGYGYDSENNYHDFLRNSILKIKIQKKINGRELSNYESYCNFEDFFRSSDSNENSYVSKNSFLNLLYKRDLNTKNALMRAGLRYNSNEILRFLNSDSSDIYEKIIILNSLEEFNINCNIEIQILPFPLILKDNLGVGFVNDTSVSSRRFRNINVNIPDGLSDSDAEKVVKEFEIMYRDFAQFNNNDRLELNFIDQVDQILFEQITNRNPSSYSHLFELFRQFSISSSNIYKKIENINKTKIFKTINNLDDSDLGDLINSRHINLSRDFYDLMKSSNFVSYRQIPLSIFYEQSQYDSTSKCFKPRKIRFYNNIRNRFILDFSYFSNFERYSELFSSKNITIQIDKVSNELRRSVIKEDIIFVLKEYDVSSNYDDILSSDYRSSFYKGDFCLLSSNFLNSNYNSGQGIQNVDVGDYADLRQFFDFAKTNGFNVIKDIIVRTYLSFFLGEDEIKVIFNTSIPNVNLSNQTIKIDDISMITSELI